MLLLLLPLQDFLDFFFYLLQRKDDAQVYHIRSSASARITSLPYSLASVNVTHFSVARQSVGRLFSVWSFVCVWGWFFCFFLDTTIHLCHAKNSHLANLHCKLIKQIEKEILELFKVILHFSRRSCFVDVKIWARSHIGTLTQTHTHMYTHTHTHIYMPICT